MEPFWELDSWRIFSTPLALGTSRERLERLLKFIRDEMPDTLDDAIVREMDLVSFAKWHVMKTLRGENPTRSGTLLLVWDPGRGKWEWVEDRLVYSTSEEFDGEIDLFFNELSKMLLRIPEVAFIKNAILSEMAKDDSLLEGLENVLEGLGWDKDSTAIRELKGSIQNRIQRIRESLERHTLKAKYLPGDDGRPHRITLEYQGKSDLFLEGIEIELSEGGVEGSGLRAQVPSASGTWLRPTRKIPVFKYTPLYEPSRYEIVLDPGKVGLPTYPFTVKEILTKTAFPREKIPQHQMLFPPLDSQDFVRIYRQGPRRGMPHSFFFWPDLDALSKISPQEIRIPEGERSIDKDLFISRHQTLVVEAGAKLKLMPGISIVSEGPVDLSGTSEKPILMSAADPSRPWGALVIRGRRLDRKASRLENVKMERGSEALADGIRYSGTLSLYDADATLSHVRFEANEGEDALNARYAHVTVESSEFLHNRSDAIDFDFSYGTIRDSLFKENGNDAIDLSFSEMGIFSNTIEAHPDKGISVGEKSLPWIHSNVIRSSGIGIAVKDLSIAKIEDSLFEKNTTAISIYEKKSRFGNGEILAENNRFIDNMANIR